MSIHPKHPFICHIPDSHPRGYVICLADSSFRYEYAAFYQWLNTLEDEHLEVDVADFPRHYIALSEQAEKVMLQKFNFVGDVNNDETSSDR